MVLVKPKLRGWSHLVGAVMAVPATAALAIRTLDDTPKAATVVVYGAALIVLLGVSALYHIGTWRPVARRVLRSLDHANIFLFIAATYTPIVFNAFIGWWRSGLLTVIWVLAAAGMASSWPALHLPRWVQTALYIGMGWVAVVALPEISARLGWTALWLFLAGGAVYTLGGVAYASKWPPLWPRVFGYHEIFHLLVLGASAVYFATILIYVVPFHRT